MKRTSAFPVALAVSLCGLGCAVNLQHGQLLQPANARSGVVGYERLSDGLDGKVGWGRFTVFAIPIVPIYITGDDSDGAEQLMLQIRDALEQAGYRASVVSSGAASGPVLRCNVQKFEYMNYTWVFPIVPTWGSIQLTTSLVGPDGRILWTRSFSGSGSSLNFFNGYTSAAKKSMNQILNPMVEAFAAHDFYAALTQS